MNWCYLHPAFVSMTTMIGLATYGLGKSAASVEVCAEPAGIHRDGRARANGRKYHITAAIFFFLSLINAFG